MELRGRSDQPEEMSTASMLIVGNIYTSIVLVLYCIVFVSLLRNAKFSAANSSPALMAILSIAEIHIQNTLDTNGDCGESFSKTAASGLVIFKDKAIPACKVTARLSDEIVKSTPKQHSVWKIAPGSVTNVFVFVFVFVFEI